jgi:septal ring factor EnvC (AmiA/AmiB activator)
MCGLNRGDIIKNLNDFIKEIDEGVLILETNDIERNDRLSQLLSTYALKCKNLTDELLTLEDSKEQLQILFDKYSNLVKLCEEQKKALVVQIKSISKGQKALNGYKKTRGY